MALEIKYYAYKVGVNVHHLEWCTKYRYEMFKQDKYKKLCEEILRETAQRRLHRNPLTSEFLIN